MKLFYPIVPLILGVGLLGCSTDNTASIESDAQSEVDEFLFADIEYGSDLPDSAPVLKVSTAPNNPPFSYKDEYGNLEGLDIDIIKAIGATQGFKVQINNDTESNIISNLKDEHRDIIIAGLDYNPELVAEYGISKPYHFSSVVITYLDSDLKIENKQDISKLKLGIVKGTNISDSMLSNDQVKAMHKYDTAFLGIRGLISGEVEAIAANEEVMRYTTREIPEFSPHFYRFEDSVQNTSKKVIYVDKENRELLESINAGIKEIMRNGNYGETTSKWLSVEKSREYVERFAALQEYNIKNPIIDTPNEDTIEGEGSN